MSATAPTRPVMDVATPSKRPVFAGAAKTTATKSPTSTRSALLAVRNRSLRSSAQILKSPVTLTQSDNKAQPVRQQQPAVSVLAQPEHRTPVGLITVAVFAALVLSALAVTIYVTTRTA